MSFDAPITDEHALRSLYRHVSRVARDKEIDHLDGGAREFLAATTFLVRGHALAAGRGRRHDVGPLTSGAPRTVLRTGRRPSSAGHVL